MSRYLELLQGVPDTSGHECGLGKILATEGQEKHDEVLEAIFAADERGMLYPISRLIEAFHEEYGWSEWFFRRHRNGKCVSCLNRT